MTKEYIAEVLELAKRNENELISQAIFLAIALQLHPDPKYADEFAAVCYEFSMRVICEEYKNNPELIDAIIEAEENRDKIC